MQLITYAYYKDNRHNILKSNIKSFKGEKVVDFQLIFYGDVKIQMCFCQILPMFLSKIRMLGSVTKTYEQQSVSM